MPRTASRPAALIGTPATSGRARYENDVYAWAQEQAALLRNGEMDALDLANIAEEINGVGLSEYYRLQSAVEVILIHLLNWDHQPELRSRSWTISVATHRERIAIYLRKSPSLKSSLDEARENAFRLARVEAARQMRRRVTALPPACPYTWDEILHRPIALDGEE